MVEVKGLSVKFGNFQAVKNVSFSVNKGEIFGFLGANGAGKTTTIRVLCGLLKPSAGKIIIANEKLELNPEAIKAKIGYMSQKFTLYEDLTVEENLNFAAGLRKLSRDYYQKRKNEILELISFRKPLNTMIRDLPQGIKQQVSLAAAVLHDPTIIFLDEPTAGVTPVARELFWNLIRMLAKIGKTIFVTTHYMDEAENCMRIALMRSGEIISLNTPENLKRDTFPEGIYELTLKEDKTGLKIDHFSKYSGIVTMEPYGLKYHAIVRDQQRFKNIESELKEYFYISKLNPSLEDVFIELVEGQER